MTAHEISIAKSWAAFLEAARYRACATRLEAARYRAALRGPALQKNDHFPFDGFSEPT